MKKSDKVMFVLFFISSLSISIGYTEELQYNHILTIEPPEPITGLWFGNEVDIIGDKIVISEPFATVEDLPIAGRIRVFNLEGQLQSTIQSPEPGTNYEFGRFSSHDEDIIVAYEANWVEDVKWVGSVHAFSLDGSYLFQIQPEGEPVQYTKFGTQVEISDDYIFIAERGPELSPPASGMVHVYYRNGEYLKTIYPTNPSASRQFGSTINTHNDRFYIAQSDGYNPGPGVVYVYDEEFNLVMTLESPSPENKALFGVRMSISDEYIVIGEPWATVDDTLRAGKVHIFTHEGELLRTVVAPIAEMGAQFGWSVKVVGERVVIGEINSNIGEEGDEGKVYIFSVDGELLHYGCIFLSSHFLFLRRSPG